VTSDIRVLTEPDDLNRAFEVFAVGLGLTLPAGTDAAELTEPGRVLGAFVPGPDGGPDDLVGTASAFTSWLIVPGGARVGQGALTDVGVLPTHTRRGLATAMLRRQLEEISARGESIATLRASEATIYERFGFGAASSLVSAELLVDRARPRPTLPAAGPVRYVEPDEAGELMPRIYDRVGFVGATGRPERWWRAQAWFGAATASAARRVVVHGVPGAEDGFLRYHSTSTNWMAPDPTLVVDDLVATTPEALSGLLRFLSSIDLVARVVLPKLPLDHGLEELLLDRRAIRTTGVSDETWLRLVDVEAALAARTYALSAPAGAGAGTAVTIEVRDRQLPTNDGGYRVEASGVKRTEDAPDLSTDVAALGAAYLGGVSWRQLALAGRVREHTPGALAAADALFRTTRPPFAGTMF
jgi:predicted acetyltransferase